MMKTLLTPFTKFVAWLGKVEWKASKEISIEDKALIREMIAKDYYVILTRRSNHLSTYAIGLADIVLRFKYGFWSHCLMNLEDAVTNDADFRLVQATGIGTHFAEFDKVFDVQAVALLKPKSMTTDEWTTTLDAAKAQLGKPYDSLFNIADESQLSCIELVRTVLKSQPNYEKDFANFEKMIAKSKNVTPQMLYDCNDFEIAFEVRV